MLNPIACGAVIVHGGERSSRSAARMIEGIAWKLISAGSGNWAQSGTTKLLSYSLNDQ